jgi:hypothetical protein
MPLNRSLRRSSPHPQGPSWPTPARDSMGRKPRAAFWSTRPFGSRTMHPVTAAGSGTRSPPQSFSSRPHVDHRWLAGDLLVHRARVASKAEQARRLVVREWPLPSLSSVALGAGCVLLPPTAGVIPQAVELAFGHQCFDGLVEQPCAFVARIPSALDEIQHGFDDPHPTLQTAAP